MNVGPAFYFDIASPEAYLSAERILQVMPVACEWVPVLARDLPGADSWDAYRCAEERLIARERVEQAARDRGLQSVRWPTPFPFDSLAVMRVATYAKRIGRAVPFALAAFRQAFAGGHALDSLDRIVIAAAACEMHPTAVVKAVELRGVGQALEQATDAAIQRGVRDVPAIWTASAVFHGDAELERAAEAAAR